MKHLTNFLTAQQKLNEEFSQRWEELKADAAKVAAVVPGFTPPWVQGGNTNLSFKVGPRSNSALNLKQQIMALVPENVEERVGY